MTKLIVVLVAAYLSGVYCAPSKWKYGGSMIPRGGDLFPFDMEMPLFDILDGNSAQEKYASKSRDPFYDQETLSLALENAELELRILRTDRAAHSPHEIVSTLERIIKNLRRLQQKFERPDVIAISTQKTIDFSDVLNNLLLTGNPLSPWGKLPTRVMTIENDETLFPSSLSDEFKKFQYSWNNNKLDELEGSGKKTEKENTEQSEEERNEKKEVDQNDEKKKDEDQSDEKKKEEDQSNEKKKNVNQSDEKKKKDDQSGENQEYHENKIDLEEEESI